jgi:hypothetical protein
MVSGGNLREGTVESSVACRAASAQMKEFAATIERSYELSSILDIGSRLVPGQRLQQATTGGELPETNLPTHWQPRTGCGCAPFPDHREQHRSREEGKYQGAGAHSHHYVS